MKVITRRVPAKNPFVPFEVILRFDTLKEAEKFRKEMSIVDPIQLPSIATITREFDKALHNL